MRAAIFACNLGGTIQTAYSQHNEDPMAFLGNYCSEFLRSPIGSGSHLWGYRQQITLKSTCRQIRKYTFWKKISLVISILHDYTDTFGWDVSMCEEKGHAFHCTNVFSLPINFRLKASGRQLTLKPDLSQPGPGPDHLGQTMGCWTKNSLLGKAADMTD